MKFSNPFRPEPAPPNFGAGKIIPERTAPLLSRLLFEWLSPLMGVGYSRPLEKEDLWELQNHDHTSPITDRIEEHFYARCPPDLRPHHLSHLYDVTDVVNQDTLDNDNIDGEKGKDEELKLKETDSDPSATAAPSPVDSSQSSENSRSKRRRKTKYDKSLFKAIMQTFSTRIWLAGTLKLLSDTLKTTTPLLSKVLLTWLADSYIWVRATEQERAALGLKQPHGIGYGVGLAFALFAMQEVSSLMNNHYMQISFTNGLLIRTGVIGGIFRKALRLSGRARSEHGVGKITTMISADATRLDRFTGFAHNLWVAPIQVAIGIGLLLGNIGYSALVGLGVLVLAFPLQIGLVKIMFSQRKKAVGVTDLRIRLTTEVLQGIRLIKLYAWEAFYTRQLSDLRRKEIRAIRKQAIARSVLFAVITFIPVLAAILSFITYALSGHDLDVATIFTSLQLFNAIRMPLIMLPFVLSALSDAIVALGRISGFLTAEELAEPHKVEYGRAAAVEIDGDFTWETVPSTVMQTANGKKALAGGRADGKDGAKGGGKASGKRKSKKETKKDILPISSQDISDDESKDDGEKMKKDEPETENEPFELKKLRMIVPKGAFVAIVGRVGSGKSSILEALIGEMRRRRGKVVVGGSIAYVPQTPWIRNATLRENVTFGQDDDEDKFREIIRACSLEHDLEVLPQGESTEIGEKGINLSGGQKARVSLARATYSEADIVLLDDPLSAVDAYVGKAILDNCLTSGPLAKKTRILVTHALHVLDKTDYIYVMDEGRIIEQGTYDDLTKNSVVFARLIEEYGNDQDKEEDEIQNEKKPTNDSEKAEGPGNQKKAADLMQVEERNIGAVTWSVYKSYLTFAGGIIWGPTVILLMVLMQGSQGEHELKNLGERSLPS